MALSLAWSIDFHNTLKALSKEAPLLFIPIAFCLNRRLPRRCVNDILNNYSIGICFYCFYFLARAVVRYLYGAGTDVFFYHELSTNDINAIYLSALVSMGLFWFLVKKDKTFWNYMALLFLLAFIILLSSKTIIIIDVLLVVSYYLFYSQLKPWAKATAVIVFLGLIGIGGYNSKIKGRIVEEFRPNVERTETDMSVIHNVTIHEAWNSPTFRQNDYFNGIAFRTYQVRIFTEMIQEDPVFFTGYGLNTSMDKIEQKGIEHTVYQSSDENIGYNKMNFHNQYVEAFADLGIFGFLLVVALLVVTIKNAAKSKDFVHIAFAIVMIALFLTESFLWRQRGVVFFTVFYCLFNGLLPKDFEKTNYEKNTHNRSGRFFRITSL
jgi:O-antigen ligase